MNEKWIRLWVTWFGLGRLPKAPGTWGTVGGLPLVVAFSTLGPLPYMALAFLFIMGSIPLIDAYQRSTGTQDSSEIVVDEVAGILVTMTWLPMNWRALCLGFVIFRILDILKPFPISRVDQKVRGGLGVMADDLVAGIIGNILLQVVYTHTTWLH